MVCENPEVCVSFHRWCDCVYRVLCCLFDIAFGIYNGDEAISHLMPPTRDSDVHYTVFFEMTAEAWRRREEKIFPIQVV